MEATVVIARRRSEVEVAEAGVTRFIGERKRDDPAVRLRRSSRHQVGPGIRSDSIAGR